MDQPGVSAFVIIILPNPKCGMAGNLVYDACTAVRTSMEKTVLSFLKTGQERLDELSERDGLILRATSATGLAALYAMVLLTLYILVYYLD